MGEVPLYANGVFVSSSGGQREGPAPVHIERQFFIDNLLVPILLIIEMILVDRPCVMGVRISFSRWPYIYLSSKPRPYTQNPSTWPRNGGKGEEPLPPRRVGRRCENRVLDGPASGQKGSNVRTGSPQSMRRVNVWGALKSRIFGVLAAPSNREGFFACRRCSEIERAISCVGGALNWMVLACRIIAIRLPGKGKFNSQGARPVHLIITMI